MIRLRLSCYSTCMDGRYLIGPSHALLNDFRATICIDRPALLPSMHALSHVARKQACESDKLVYNKEHDLLKVQFIAMRGL